MSNGDCTVKLAGIQVHYCVGNQRKSVWVDLNEVTALAWTAAEVPAKGPDRPSPNCDPIPSQTGPNQCGKGLVGDEPFCWWNGRDWVCGEA